MEEQSEQSREIAKKAEATIREERSTAQNRNNPAPVEVTI